MGVQQRTRSKSLVSFINEAEVGDAREKVEIGVFSKTFGVAEVFKYRPDHEIQKRGESHHGR